MALNAPHCLNRSE
jgi:hypothetical protein